MGKLGELSHDLVLVMGMMVFTSGSRCDLLYDKKANGTLLRLLQVLFIHVVLILEQADRLGFGPFALDHGLLVVTLLQVHSHLALVRHVLAETMGTLHNSLLGIS